MRFLSGLLIFWNLIVHCLGALISLDNFFTLIDSLDAGIIVIINDYHCNLANSHTRHTSRVSFSKREINSVLQVSGIIFRRVMTNSLPIIIITITLKKKGFSIYLLYSPFGVKKSWQLSITQLLTCRQYQRLRSICVYEEI